MICTFLANRVVRTACITVIASLGGVFGSAVFAQNLTVGDDDGGDHIAFTFSPYRFVAHSGEDVYRDHVSSAAGMGQQYGYIAYEETADPDTNVPINCTVARFYTLIHDETNYLGTLLIAAHGGDDLLSIEPFEKTPAGKTARDARYDAYKDPDNPVIPGVPLTDAVIYKSENANAWAVGVRAQFIRTYGRLNRGLVYLAACHGGSMTDDFVAANARVSLGNTDCASFAQDVARVTTFFSRMDGKEGQANRPVSAARAGLPLTAAGFENTTLAPSVLQLNAPCPIKTGDIVTITLDTTCEVGIAPDITCNLCTIANEVWLNSTTLQGTCTAPPPPGVDKFTITLPWAQTWSDQNVARLDGNTNPAGSNAEGPAHDDYVQPFACQEKPEEPGCDPVTVPYDCFLQGTGTAADNCGCDWLEDFESYPLGEIPQATYPGFPPGTEPQSNYWAGWYYDPNVRGTVADDQDHTTGAGQSMRIDQGDDQVHWFLGRGVGAGDPSEEDPNDDGVGYDDDVSVYWIHTGHVFIPNDHTDDHYYILNSHYTRIPNDPMTLRETHFHVQIEFNSARDLVWDSLPPRGQPPDGESLPLVKGAWAEVRVEINFDKDVHLIFYDGDFLAGYQWAASQGAGTDALFLGNLDLFSNQGNYAWYDDLSMIQGEPPPQSRPDFECFLKELDQDRCATFLWHLTNMNDEGDIDRFYIDVDAGEGGRNQTCRGTALSTAAWTEVPPGWTVTNCTGWEFPGQRGHALFQFNADTPTDAIGLGETVIGGFRVDTNLSRDYERPDDVANGIRGKTIPAFTVLMSAAQQLGNEAWEICDTGGNGGFSFGPAQGAPQEWSGVNTCEALLNVPALSSWTKLILVALILAGGTMLVLRSRRMAAA